MTDAEHTPWKASRAAIEVGGYGRMVLLVPAGGASVTESECEQLAQRIVRSVNSHVIEAAEADLLGEALKACREAKELYDHMSLGTLEAAAKYGPGYEPPNDEDCLRVRGLLGAVLAKSGADHA